MTIPWEDTLISLHSFASHLVKRLDFAVTAAGIDSAPWKISHGRRGDDGEKGSLSKIDEKSDGVDLCKYNASDCKLTIELWERLQSNEAAAKELRVYKHDMRLAEVCRHMHLRGIRVDADRRIALAGALRERESELLGEMRSLLAWPEFRPGSLPDVREALFERLGSRWTLATGTGLPSTSDAALEGLQGLETPAGAFAERLLRWRKAGKIRSTYLDALKPDPAHRVHFNWKSFGTVSGRLASRFQSVPRYKRLSPEDRIREIYVAAPGHTFVYFDVAQAEMRAAAYLSGDPVFIAATCKDIHAENAKVCFPEVDRMGWLDGDALKDPERGKKFRDILKNFGFAISYCAEAEKLWVTLVRKGFKVKQGQVAVQLANLRAAYKVYFRWVAENHERVKRTGYMRSPYLGRIRWLGRFCPVTEVANFPIQSFVADIVNERTIALASDGFYPVAQVHDACIYECTLDRVSELKEKIAEAWSKPICLSNGETLVLPIDLKTGERWSELG